MTLVAAALAASSGGFGARVGGPDLYALQVARHRYVAETLLAGRLPLWNPYEFCGAPLLGAGVGSALYPPVILANLLLPPNAALQVLYDVHIAAYVLLTLVYLTRHGIGLGPAIAGAAVAAAGIFRAAAAAGADHPVFLFSLVFIPAILLAWDALMADARRAAAAIAL